MMIFFTRIFIYPTVVLIANLLVPGVRFSHLYEAVTLGLVLAAADIVMDFFILRKGSFWISNGVDFVVAFFIIYLSRIFSHGAAVTIPGALITALLLLIVEYSQNLFLIRTNQVGKVK